MTKVLGQNQGKKLMSANLDTIIEQVKQLPPEELAELLKEVKEIQENGQTSTKPAKINYLDFLGSGKGAYSSVEEADEFIRKERDAWED